MKSRHVLLALLVTGCGRTAAPFQGRRATRSAGDGGALAKDGSIGMDASNPNDANGCPLFARYYRSPDEWMQAASPTQLEGFDMERPRFEPIPLPYATASGLEIGSPPTNVEVQIVPMGNVDGSIALLFRTFGEELNFRFPGRITAAGFFYQTNESQWELRPAENEAVELSAGMTGFIGVILECGSVRRIRIAGPSQLSGGLFLDDIAWR